MSLPHLLELLLWLYLSCLPSFSKKYCRFLNVNTVCSDTKPFQNYILHCCPNSKNTHKCTGNFLLLIFYPRGKILKGKVLLYKSSNFHKNIYICVHEFNNNKKKLLNVNYLNLVVSFEYVLYLYPPWSQ